MPTATRKRERKGVQRPEPQVNPLPAHFEPLAPQAVLAASKALAEGQAAREAARVAAEKARAAVDQARAADNQAAMDAARSGKSAPAATAPKAEAKAEQAERSYDARQELARQAAQQMLAVVREHREAMIEAAQAELAAQAAAAAEHVAAIETALVRRRKTEYLCRALERDLDGREASFVPELVYRRPRDPVVPDTRALLDALVAELGQDDS